MGLIMVVVLDFRRDVFEVFSRVSRLASLEASETHV